jgi:hypothetical protein
MKGSDLNIQWKETDEYKSWNKAKLALSKTPLADRSAELVAELKELQAKAFRKKSEIQETLPKEAEPVVDKGNALSTTPTAQGDREAVQPPAKRTRAGTKSRAGPPGSKHTSLTLPAAEQLPGGTGKEISLDIVMDD